MITSIPLGITWQNGVANPITQVFAWEQAYGRMSSLKMQEHPQVSATGKKEVNRDEIRQRVFLRLAASPLVLGPLVLGFTSMVSAWAFDFRQAGLFIFGGIAGMLIGAGSFVSKLLLSGNKEAHKVLTEVEKEKFENRQKSLDELERALERSDNDPRPEEALGDLRTLVGTFQSIEKDSSSGQWAIMVDVRLQVESLFAHCVRLIEQTHHLRLTADKLSTEAARHPILEQRELIIHEIQACVKQLSHSLVSLQKLGHVQASTQDLQQMRKELDSSLEVARKVEERMQNWSVGSGLRSMENI